MPKQSDVFKQLRILHGAMLMGTLTFTIIVFLGQKYIMKNNVDEALNKVLPLVALVITATALLSGLWLYKKRVADIQNSKEPIQNRMDQYRAACIVLWALVEGPALLSAIGILLTGNYIFVGISALLLVILTLYAPRKESIIERLNLETSDVAELESTGEAKP